MTPASRLVDSLERWRHAAGRVGRRDRRALAIGAILLLPMIGWTLVVRPIAAHVVELREGVQRERDLLARELELLDVVYAPPAVHVLRDSILSTAFTGSDDVEATAALATWMGEQALDASVALAEVETLPSVAAEGSLSRVHVSVRAEGDFEGLLAWLRAVEGGDRAVRITRLHVTRAGRSRWGEAGQVTGAGAAPTAEVLSVVAAFEGLAVLDSAATARGRDRVAQADKPGRGAETMP